MGIASTDLGCSVRGVTRTKERNRWRRARQERLGCATQLGKAAATGCAASILEDSESSSWRAPPLSKDCTLCPLCRNLNRIAPVPCGVLPSTFTKRLGNCEGSVPQWIPTTARCPARCTEAFRDAATSTSIGCVNSTLKSCCLHK